MGEHVGGSCLCGTVKFTVAGPYTAFRYCHCSRCRKASGSAHAANLVVPKSQFEWLAGESSIKRYDLPGAQRFSVWTCTECGTRVPHAIRTRDDMLVPAGTLDGDPGLRPEHSIFWDSRAPWYVECGDMPHFTEYAG
ncbi:MAG TPA: GFA family protein [Burkholderiales bacterium]|nr:GFA family protein [Burkholderiales bacterium]